MVTTDPSSEGTQPTQANLRPLELSSVRQRALTHLGIEDGRTEVLWAETLRAESTAIGAVPRRVLLERATRTLEPLGSVDREALLELCRRLEWIGDITSASGGYVAPSPLRVVRMEDERYLLVGSARTAQVRRALGRIQIVESVPRKGTLLPGQAAVNSADVAPLGGVVITAERWAGLDRVLPLGEVLADLDAQLDAPHRHVTREIAVPWTRLEMYVPDAAEPRGHRRWRTCPAIDRTALVREKQPGGWTAYAWARPGLRGATPQRIVLSSDQARRATFALDATANAPLTLDAVGAGDRVELRAAMPFPRAEYRYLVAASESVSSDGFPIRYQIPRALYARVADVLRAQLGVVLRETMER